MNTFSRSALILGATLAAALASPAQASNCDGNGALCFNLLDASTPRAAAAAIPQTTASINRMAPCEDYGRITGTRDEFYGTCNTNTSAPALTRFEPGFTFISVVIDTPPPPSDDDEGEHSNHGDDDGNGNDDGNDDDGNGDDDGGYDDDDDCGGYCD